MSESLLSIANTVGNISLPVVLWYLLQRQGQQNSELLERLHQNHKEQIQILTDVVRKNTEALAEIGTAVHFISTVQKSKVDPQKKGKES